MLTKIKNIATSILPILVVFLSFLEVIDFIYMQEKLEELHNLDAYMVDTTNIMQNKIDGLEKRLYALLMEESNPVETYMVEVIQMRTEENKYDVKISVILKETSAGTKCSFFFGTTEVPLKLNKYVYEGVYTLSLDENYDGNAAVLVDTGGKRTTKVLEDYVSPLIILLPEGE